MSENKNQEIDALLEFIQRKRFELLEEYCLPWKRCVKSVLDRDEAQPRNKEEKQFGHIPAPDPDLVFKYSSDIEYNDVDFGKTYLDVSEYWEKFHREYITVEHYISNVMEAHWFLLYYTHRFRLTNWNSSLPSAIWIENSNAASVKEIDGYLIYILDHYGPTFGREMIQDIMTFAAKAIQAIAPVSIIDIYEDVKLDRPARINALESRLNSLPFTQSMVFTEVFDSLLFTLERGHYMEILAFHMVFCHGILSYRYLYIKDESFQKYFNFIKKDFPHVLPPYFEDAEALLSGIKQEYSVNRELVDGDICKIIDGWLGFSQGRKADGDKPNETQLIPEVEEKYRYTVPMDVFDANKRIVDDKFYVQKLVKEVKEGENPVEHFQELFQYILQWGKIENKAEQDAMLSLITGYYIRGAASRARWCGDEYMPRVLYHIVKHISESRRKYAPLMYVEFYSNDPKKAVSINQDLETIRNGNISAKADETVPSGVRRKLWQLYQSIFPKPKE